MANGLTGVDFVRCWLSWSILPLSRRSKLMCQYTGKTDDPQRHTDIMLPEKEVIETAKKMLNISLEECSQTGLAPYYKKNKLPAVSLNLSCLRLIRPYELLLVFIFPFLHRPTIRFGRENLRISQINSHAEKPSLLRRKRQLLAPVHMLKKMIRTLRYELILMCFDLFYPDLC